MKPDGRAGFSYTASLGRPGTSRNRRTPVTIRCYGLIAGLVVAGWVVVGRAEAQDKKDPQAAFEPRSNPGAGQKFLEKFVGTWDVVKTFYPRSGDPVRAKGECRQTMVDGGRFLRLEFIFQQGDTKTVSLGVVGFEAESALFPSLWNESRSMKITLRQRREKFD